MSWWRGFGGGEEPVEREWRKTDLDVSGTPMGYFKTPFTASLNVDDFRVNFILEGN